MPYSMFHFFKL